MIKGLVTNAVVPIVLFTRYSCVSIVILEWKNRKYMKTCVSIRNRELWRLAAGREVPPQFDCVITLSADGLEVSSPSSGSVFSLRFCLKPSSVLPLPLVPGSGSYFIINSVFYKFLVRLSAANFHCAPSVLMVDELLSAYPHQLTFSEAGMRVMMTSHFSPRTRLTMASRMLITEVRAGRSSNTLYWFQMWQQRQNQRRRSGIKYLILDLQLAIK